MPLWAVTAVFMLFFILVPGRMTPGMALVTGAADPRLRGTFMSLSSSVQQLASGLAAFVGGAIVSTDASGHVLHYPWVALVGVCATALSMWVAWQVRAPDSAQPRS
jgi:predicted MFS family arabinose efflux permease